MKKYRHREEGYIVEAEPYSSHADTCIRTYGYHQSDSAYAYPYAVLFRLRDFEKLFEPVPEYCCPPFRHAVNDDLIRKISSGGWTCLSGPRDAQIRAYHSIYYCQFCGKKL